MPSDANPYEPPLTSSGGESPKTSSRGRSLLWISLAAYVFCFTLPYAAEYYFNFSRFTDGKLSLRRELTWFFVGPLIIPVIASAFSRKNFLRFLPWSLILLAHVFLFFGIVTISIRLGW